MDSNEINQSDSVQASELSALKTEAVKEELEDNESTDPSNHNNIKEKNIDENPNNLPPNGQKRKSTESFPQEECEDNPNSIKRRRYTDTQLDQLDDSAPNSSIEESEKFTLIVSNSSGDWTSQQVLDYIRDTCGVQISKVNDSRKGNTDSDFQIKLKFGSIDQLNTVREKLKEKEIEGKFTTEIESEMVEQTPDTKDGRDSDAESNETIRIGEIEPQNTESPLRHDQDHETDTNDFHIREEYLLSLGITPPITNWVDVTNFRCDKSELKEVLELAGRVLICSVVTSMHRYANAMYSHPLEAVQAVSMLNGQTFYGQKLKVTINSSPNVKTLLPKGLLSVGPGLGKSGQPVRDLPDQYKKFIRGQNSDIDASLFQQELLNRIGVTLDRDVSYLRSADSYSQTSHNDQSNRDSGDSSETVFQRSPVNENQFGPIGQKPPVFHNMPVSDIAAQSVSVNINTNGPNALVNRIPVLNSNDFRTNQRYSCPPVSRNQSADRLVISSAVITGQHSVSGHIGGAGPISGSGHILGIAHSGPISGLALMNCTGPMSSSGPISGPGPLSNSGPISVANPRSNVGSMSGSGPMSGPVSMTVPGPMSGPGLMPGPMSLPGSLSGVGPISGPITGPGRMPGPGHLSSGSVTRPSLITGACPRPMTAQGPPSGPLQLSGPRGPASNQMVHISIGPRVPMPMNRFPAPISPMVSRNVAPMRPVQNQIRPNGPRPMISGTNIQMFRSDPVTLQISNLPPNTNFLNLGHKLSELGHVVYLEFTTPGCAVVRFGNPTDAERCFQNYRNVLG